MICFFFQAEDGIRDYDVTGVQTCALPILMVIRRETNSWRWPIFTFVYMTVLAYVGAFVTYQVGMMFV